MPIVPFLGSLLWLGSMNTYSSQLYSGFIVKVLMGMIYVSRVSAGWTIMGVQWLMLVSNRLCMKEGNDFKTSLLHWRENMFAGCLLSIPLDLQSSLMILQQLVVCQVEGGSCIPLDLWSYGRPVGVSGQWKSPRASILRAHEEAQSREYVCDRV